MAKYYSGDEVITRLKNLREILDDLIAQRRSIEKEAQAREASGQDAVTVASAINTLLTDWGALKLDVVTNLSAIPTAYQSKVRIGMPERFNAAFIAAAQPSNVTNGITGGMICPSSFEACTTVNPFSVFANGDVVSITNAEDAGNDITGTQVVYTPDSASTSVIAEDSTKVTAGTNWTAAGLNETFVGTATAAATGSALKFLKANMFVTWTAGKKYLVRFTISSISAGSVSVGTNTAAYYTGTAATEHFAVVTADSHADGLVFKSADAVALTATIKNISCTPFNGLLLTSPLGKANTADSSLVVTLQER